MTFSLFTPPVFALETNQGADTNVPKLLITEVVPDSTNLIGVSADGYEFIEVYNNTAETINFKDYDIAYRYPDKGSSGDVVWSAGDTDIFIPSKSSIVFWVMNSNNGDLTAADFNKNYGTSLEEKVNLFRLDGGGGMSNSSARDILIKDKSGAEIVMASYQNDEQTIANKGIFYKHPTPGSIQMVMDTAGIDPATPGTVTTEQVSPETKPIIQHTVPMQSANPQDLALTAQVTDDQSVDGVTLFYKNNEEDTYKSIPMTFDKDDQYIAVIPKEAMEGISKLQYYIEATDGVNVVNTLDKEGKLYEIQIFNSDKPIESELMITEIVPANVGTDKYEYVEVYNNTNKDMNLEDYKLLHENRGGASTLIDIPTDFILKAKETAVIWLQSYDSKNESIAKFNAHYGTNLDEGKVLPVYWNGIGLHDSAEGRILIAADAAYPVSHAAEEIISQAWFSVTQDDAIDGKSVVYEYPKDGSNRMFLRGSGQQPTPGVLTNGQVPGAPIEVAEDEVSPVISHEPSTDAQEIMDFTLEATVTDNQAIKQVSLYFKRNDASEYTRVNMLRSDADKFISELILRYQILNAEYIDYYFTATDGFNTVSTLDNGGKPYRLGFVHQTEPLILNFTDGQILRGNQLLEGRGKTDNHALGMSLDGQVLETQPSMPEDAYILFEAYDIDNFLNGVFVNDTLASIMPQVNNYNFGMVPLPKELLKPGVNKITLTSGTKTDPKSLEGNNDDYKLQNVEILTWTGEKPAITAEIQSDTGKLTPVADPKARITLKDSLPQIHYTIDLPVELFTAVSKDMDTTTLTDGEHQLQLTSVNGESISAKVVVDNTAPVIENLSIEDGKSYKEQISLNVTATDVTSGIDKITALLDGEPVELPFSPNLEAGTHTFEVNVTDKAGNVTTKKVSFTMVNQNPDQPSEAKPTDNVRINGNKTELSVKVTDPDGDAMNVDFYKAYKYDFVGDSTISAYSNSTDREPPLELVPSGEEAFSNDAISKVKEKDGQYFVTDAEGKFPYHRFDFTIDEELSSDDEVEVVWEGHSLEGRQVTMYTWNYNTQKWERATAGMGSKDFKLKAKVNVGDMVRDNVLHVLIQDLFPSPEDVDFTFAWVSDTQYYADAYPQIYRTMMQYLVDQKEEKKIAYSIHTGDIVDDWNRPDEWAVADESMKLLDDAGMNYGVVAGNHDVHFTEADYSEYYKYFGRDRFENQPTYGDDLNNNRDHYDLVSQNGQDLLIMYLGWDVQEETIKWANDVLKKYPDRQAIIATHSYITPSGAYGGEGYGEKIWTDIVAPNENVFMVLCGHFHGVAYNVKHTPDGRTVVEMLADYQSGLEGGGGYIRFLQFDLDNQKIHVNTYSPYKDDENFFDEPGKDEFDIDFKVQPAAKQVATDYIGVNVYTDEKIGSNENVESGSTATVSWRKLPANSFVSWYTRMTDEFGGNTVSDVWRFKTGAPVTPPGQEDKGHSQKPESKDETKAEDTGATDPNVNQLPEGAAEAVKEKNPSDQ